MEPDRAGAGAAAADAWRAELTRLRVARRRQAVVIATLSAAVSNFHRGLKALREENAELRARVSSLSNSASRSGDEVVELAIEAGPDAPAIARRAVTGTLSERVAAPVLANTQLLMSELVTNSVRHSGVPAGDELIVRLRVWHDHCRVEVEDPGHEGVIAPRASDPDEASGMGLTLVQSLSERWGLVRAADGPTRVWAQVRCEAAPVHAS
jgi:anti-sigma regulatory factor (Ser/Thr protein kinase)